jgi:hypothetical protein
MKIHLIIPNKYYETAVRIEQLCWPHKVTFASRDTDQLVSIYRIYDRNIELIQNSDLVIPIFKDAGKDFNFELGYATSLNKIKFSVNYNINEKDLMSYVAARKIITENELMHEISKIDGIPLD